MTYIVALTGGIGSGKSTVAKAFAQLGVPLVDADVIARQVIAPGSSALKAITTRYGGDVLGPDGRLNRARLRQQIFTHTEEREWLNGLLHPLIQQETQRQLALITTLYALWIAPLLIENGVSGQANRVLVVDVAPEIQIARVMARDNITCQQAEAILAAQAPREQRLAYADDIIDNSGDPAVIVPCVAALHDQYLKLAAVSKQDLYR